MLASILVLLLGLQGCAITLATTTFSPAAAGDASKPTSTTDLVIEPIARSGRDVFTCHFQTAGVWYATSDPTANGMPTVNVRWLTGAHIGDSLTVGIHEPQPAAPAKENP
jgi:hypothetical protein